MTYGYLKNQDTTGNHNAGILFPIPSFCIEEKDSKKLQVTVK